MKNEECRVQNGREAEVPEMISEATIFYDTKELAKIFGCSIPTAREIMHRRDFPLLVVGRKMLVAKPALEKWAMERRA